MAAQEHANVARLIGISPPEHPDLCLIAEYYPNGNIAHYLANNPNVDRRRLVFQTALGMSFLHTEVRATHAPRSDQLTNSQRDITHGSLRPSNILVDEDGNACISDCGMVELTPSTHPEAHRYYSPEAWKGVRTLQSRRRRSANIA
ncbi:kinase-like protein [Cylindrobasidium torrendii FP15055 ss-10]|uniref:Kinase-like protein n=1 Tax=Cylindrobasidium torrendii FP15055 ss-10 TaxID=1314674 RepID=A0A0D7B8B2_9AGAR|nr:kinase-like protein [Cylindrobasidium torrendii FP15055 ss-10]